MEVRGVCVVFVLSMLFVCVSVCCVSRHQRMCVHMPQHMCKCEVELRTHKEKIVVLFDIISIYIYMYIYICIYMSVSRVCSLPIKKAVWDTSLP